MNIEMLGVAVAMTVGLVEVAKKAGLPTRFAPLFAVAIGIGAASLLIGGFGIAGLTFGIISGLTASGLYSGVKTTATPSDEKEDKKI